MPYIKKECRPYIEKCLFNLDGLTSGELNYTITRLLLKQKPKNYEDFNRLIGVLECVKQEFYRRAVAVYEDKKIEENGDVY